MNQPEMRMMRMVKISIQKLFKKANENKHEEQQAFEFENICSFEMQNTVSNL